MVVLWEPGDPLYSHYSDDEGCGRYWDDTYARFLFEVVDDLRFHVESKCSICRGSYREEGHPDDPTDPDEVLQTCLFEVGGCGEKHSIQCPRYDHDISDDSDFMW